MSCSSGLASARPHGIRRGRICQYQDRWIGAGWPPPTARQNGAAQGWSRPRRPGVWVTWPDATTWPQVNQYPAGRCCASADLNMPSVKPPVDLAYTSPGVTDDGDEVKVPDACAVLMTPVSQGPPRQGCWHQIIRSRRVSCSVSLTGVFSCSSRNVAVAGRVGWLSPGQSLAGRLRPRR
jgi:hypothetical protein